MGHEVDTHEEAYRALQKAEAALSKLPVPPLVSYLRCIALCRWDMADNMRKIAAEVKKIRKAIETPGQGQGQP